MLLLSLFGHLETFLADDLYPHRYVIAPIAGLLLAAVALGAYRLGILRFVRAHRRSAAILGAPAIIVAVVAGNYLLSPLWERSSLTEASPLVVLTESVADPVGSPVPSSGTNTSALSSPAITARETHKGSFRGADDFHFGRGKASLISTAEGGRVLRFEEFSVRNGPDLYVYLSKDVDGRRVTEALNLGRLKATDGAFNYELPANLDLTGVESVVVWCRQFSTLFAVARLAEV